jgi:DNA-binding transcriptional LysR family regulator
MWQDIDLREIRVFLVLSEELHFGRTAERIGITQSRASQALRSLERKLGVQLAHRTSRRVTLTEAGKHLLQQLKPAHDALGDALRRTAAGSRQLQGTLRIGVVNPAAGAPRLLEIIDRFETANPACRVECVQLPLRDRFGPLRRGELGAVMARVPLDSPDMVAGPVFTRDVPALAVARSHPLARLTSVTLEDLADSLVCDLDRMHAGIGGERVPATTPSGRAIQRHPARIDDVNQLTLLIARGQAVYPTIAWLDPDEQLVPTIVIHPSVVHLPILDLPKTATAICWQRNTRDPLRRELVRMARTILAAPHPR